MARKKCPPKALRKRKESFFRKAGIFLIAASFCFQSVFSSPASFDLYTLTCKYTHCGRKDADEPFDISEEDSLESKQS